MEPPTEAIFQKKSSSVTVQPHSPGMLIAADGDTARLTATGKINGVDRVAARRRTQ